MTYFGTKSSRQFPRQFRGFPVYGSVLPEFAPFLESVSFKYLEPVIFFLVAKLFSADMKYFDVKQARGRTLLCLSYTFRFPLFHVVPMIPRRHSISHRSSRFISAPLSRVYSFTFLLSDHPQRFSSIILPSCCFDSRYSRQSYPFVLTLFLSPTEIIILSNYNSSWVSSVRNYNMGLF